LEGVLEATLTWSPGIYIVRFETPLKPSASAEGVQSKFEPGTVPFHCQYTTAEPTVYADDNTFFHEDPLKDARLPTK
jgi:hypothetical protein